ncbi:MAG: hypothetical protein F4013_11790 [Gammaproteobacteria bacterium]|nr:hypothetical protein [Gammaproteobacteria bacterium]MYL02340.1 hypothetical protein [Gammaproteobacteria bacterium]
MNENSAELQECADMAKSACGDAADMELCASGASDILKNAVRSIKALTRRPDAGEIAEPLRRVEHSVSQVPILAEHAEYLCGTFRTALVELDKKIQTALPQVGST